MASPSRRVNGQQLRTPVSPLVFGASTRQQESHHDVFDLNHQLVSPIMSRSPSVASDRYSVVSGLTSNTYLPGNPQHVNPAPAYVAPSGAAQVVSDHSGASQRPSGSDDEDGMKSKNDVQFSGPALQLINSFLDQLLFSFLSTARSTSLHTLRPAVTDVLKARLARDAIASAEEDLQDLLAGGEEEEEENTRQNSAENSRSWDLELVWKRTRLRVMVYMRLGEMEDEDEERYIKEEELFHGSERRFSQTSGLVSWAAAIFLTGVLEYVAEQTLQTAGQAAQTRARRQSRTSRAATPSPEEQQQNPVVVEDHDVEKVALNSTLGRLWRTWRKSLRNTAATPATPTHRFSRLGNENFSMPTSHRRGSLGTGADGSVAGDVPPPRMRLDDVPEMQFPEHVLASNIPLPIGDRQRDVDEIEVPGLARDPDAEEEKQSSHTPTARRNSFTSRPAYKTTGGLPTPDSTSPTERNVVSERPGFHRQRSMSVPTPARTPINAEEMKEPPGAFPEEIAEEQQQPGEDHPEEQKASAQEMAPHRRESQDVKALLDKVVNHEPADETSEQQDKSEHHGLIGGAIAGAAAAATAAAALVYGSKDNDKGAAETEHPAEDTKEVDERDNRKSLLDMKTLIGPGQAVGEGEDAAQIMTSRKVSVAQPVTPPTMVRSGSDESRKSEVLKDPYRLGDKSGQGVPYQSPAKRQHMRDAKSGASGSEEGGIGVASTSNSFVESPVMTKTPSPNADEQQARGPGKRPSRLNLGGQALTRNNIPDSPSFRKNDSPKGSPRDFLESRSLTSKTERPDFSERAKQPSPTDQTRAVPLRQVPQKRRSIPGLAFTSASSTPIIEKNAHRQSWSAAIQQQREQQEGGRRVSVPSVPTVPAAHRQDSPSENPVHEHPVVQRMASLKRNEKQPEASAAGDAAVLTSASIRGPEDFDMFVQGADTMKYTLTPETVRNGPVQNTSSQQAKRNSPVELSSAPSVSRRSAGPPIDTSDTRTGRSAVSKQATSAVPDGDRDAEREAERKRENRRSVSKPPPRNTSTHRKSGLIAREPQVLTESTRDFADFIRSTGPNKGQEVTPIINPASASMVSLHSIRSNGAPSRSSSVVSQERERSKSLSHSAMVKENIPPVPPVPAKGSKRAMQARPPTGNKESSSELIDFIRTGPNEEGQRRISRSVAPFRNTMDSDQMKDMGDRINGSSSPLDLRLNTNVGSAPSLPSARSQTSVKPTSSGRGSANTRAGPLLANNANATVHPAHSGQPQRISKNSAGPSTLPPVEGGATPVRKRHRNKDPYAIDTDDEDDDLLTALPKNKRPEESLVDFLNNNEPPADNGPRPLATGGNAQPKSIMSKSRASSISSLRAANANAAEAAAGARTKSMQSQIGPRPGSVRSVQSNSSAPRAPGNRPYSQVMAGAPPIPITNRSKMEARSPGTPNKPDQDGAPMGGLSKQSGTKDLADFLKNSGPPDDDKSAPAPIVGRQSKLNPKDAEKARKKTEKESMKAQKEKKGGGGFFARFTGGKRKTWLDMP